MDKQRCTKWYHDAKDGQLENLENIRQELQDVQCMCEEILGGVVSAEVVSSQFGYLAVLFRHKAVQSNAWAAYGVCLRGDPYWLEGTEAPQFDDQKIANGTDGDPRFIIDPEMFLWERLGEWVAKVEFAAKG